MSTEPRWRGNLQGPRSCEGGFPVLRLRFGNKSSLYLPPGKLKLDPSTDTSSVNALAELRFAVSPAKCSVLLSELWL